MKVWTIRRPVNAVLYGTAIISFGLLASPVNAAICDVKSGAWPCYSGKAEIANEIDNTVTTQPTVRDQAGTKVRGSKKSRAKKRSRSKSKVQSRRQAGLRRKASKRRYYGARRTIVRRGANIGCIPGRLRGLMAKIRAHYGRPLIISSGYRSRRHNRRVGGARRSLHMGCKAIDFRIAGVSKYKLARYVKRLTGRGGVGTYCGKNIIHLDVGPRRTWHWGCRKRRSRKYYASRSKSRYLKKSRARSRITSRRKARRRS